MIPLNITRLHAALDAAADAGTPFNETDVIDYLLGAVAGLVDAGEWDAAMARAFTNARQWVA
jgi:hypothetical protein